MPPEKIMLGAHHVDVVGANRVTKTLDTDFICNDDDVVWIPYGETVPLNEEVKCEHLIVGGTLVAGDVDEFVLRVHTLTILPEGNVYLHNTGKVIINAVPINTAEDPEQIGGGIVNLGGLYIEGLPKTTHAKVTFPISWGNQLIVTEDVSSWQIGDKIVIPDTNQPGEIGANIEERYIADFIGNTIELDSPVDYDHKGWVDETGVSKELFSIINLNQSISIESENPEVLRGHTINIGRADYIAKNCAFKDLGRTTTEPLNSFNMMTGQPGTNQIARYATHLHHYFGRPHGRDYQWEMHQVVVNGSAKWGISIHNSYFGKLSDSVFYDCIGAAIVTEESHSYGNDIVNNVVIGSKKPGSGQRITDRSGRNDNFGDFWHDRVGLGLGSAANNIKNNEIYSCKEGIGMVGFGTTGLRFPITRGISMSQFTGNTRAVYNSETKQFEDGDWFYFSQKYGETQSKGPYPFGDCSNNKVMGCWRGIETWTANSFVDYDERFFENLSIFNAKYPTDFEDHQETALYGWKICGDFSIGYNEQGIPGNYAIVYKPGYEFGENYIGCEFRGYTCCYRQINPVDYVNFINCTIQCDMVIYQPMGSRNQSCRTLFKNCKFPDINGKNPDFISGWFTKYGPILFSCYKNNKKNAGMLDPVSIEIRPWHDGRYLKVYNYAQHKDWKVDQKCADKLVNPEDYLSDFPPGVTSQAELVALGTPIYGEVIPDNAEQFGQYFYASEIRLEDRVEVLEQLVEKLMRCCHDS